MWNGTAIKEIGFHNHIHILEHRPEDIQTDKKTNQGKVFENHRKSLI